VSAEISRNAGFFPNSGKRFLGSDTEVSAVVTESRVEDEGALPLNKGGLNKEAAQKNDHSGKARASKKGI
jgi:hypothetical protein